MVDMVGKWMKKETKKGMKPRVLLIYDHNSRGALRALLVSAADDQYSRDRSHWERDWEHGHEPPKMDLRGMTVDTVEIKGCVQEDLQKQAFSEYSVACLCLHGGGCTEDFKVFVAKCQKAGAIPIGVADSTYYNSEEVVPEVSGLIRCLSNDLLQVIESHLQ